MMMMMMMLLKVQSCLVLLSQAQVIVHLIDLALCELLRNAQLPVVRCIV